MLQLLKPMHLESVLSNEKPLQWEAHTLQLKSSLQVEKAQAQQRGPSATKNKIN